jgi:hypothetical protein
MDINAVGRSLRVPIAMSVQDLAAICEQLRDAVKKIAIEKDAGGKPTASGLRPLAEIGNYAFKRVFGDRDALAAIEKVLGSSTNVSIEVASEEFFLPWELLYPESLEKSLSYEHFWGMNYVISRVITTTEHRPGAFVIPVIFPPFTVGLLKCDGLPSVIKKEIPFFEKLEKDGKIVLFQLRALDPNPEKKQEGIGEFKVFWKNGLKLAHFACHAFYDKISPNQSRIQLSEKFRISLQDMVTYDVDISGHPLIIINACETGNLNPLYTAHFVARFLKSGARGVVATECAVPDAFAADFAIELCTSLFAGEPLGKSLLATRRYFLEEHDNPSGLLYSMYASPDIKLLQCEPVLDSG